MGKSHNLPPWLPLIGWNLVAALALLIGAISLTYADLRLLHDTVEGELAGMFLGALWLVAIPLSFWLANRGLFRLRGWDAAAQLGLVVLLAVFFLVVSFYPLLRFHIALGGSL